MANRTAPPEPTDADLRESLAKSYTALETLLQRNHQFRPEWKYYGAKLGWSLKLFDGKRNLCFIAPQENHFIVAFVLGARGVEQALASQLPERLKQEIRTARTYAEGRGIRVTVRTTRDLAPVQQLLEIKRSK